MNRRDWKTLGWSAIALFWLVESLLIAFLTAFRAVKHAGIANTFQFEDVPLLRFFDLHYPDGYRIAQGLAAVILISFALSGALAIRRKRGTEPRPPGWRLVGGAMAPFFWASGFFACSLWACRFEFPPDKPIATILPTGNWDWIAIAFAVVASFAWLQTVVAQSGESCGATVALPPIPRPRCQEKLWSRLSKAYVLGCVAVFLYALRDHLKFWDQTKNGGFNYAQFFREEEIPQANLVLYSTSILFASGIAFAGLFAVLLIRRICRSSEHCGEAFHHRHITWLAFFSSALWTFVLMGPWQIKIWPEISAEKGWIFPALTLGYTLSALLPWQGFSLLLLLGDFQRIWHADAARRSRKVSPFTGANAQDASANSLASETSHNPATTQTAYETRGEIPFPRPAELTYWTFLTFPILPLLHLLKLPNRIVLRGILTVVSGASIYGLFWLIHFFASVYDFDDWRGMIRTAHIPFLRVFVALLAAGLCYFTLRSLLGGVVRWLEFVSPSGTGRSALGNGEHPAGGNWKTKTLRLLNGCLKGSILGGRAMMALAALVLLGLGSWPFWGWGHVSKNVLAHTVEYNNRHNFELQFMHWLLDWDRDGYSALLHGADPNDFDPLTQAGGLAPPATVDVPIDQLAIADSRKAKEFPNLAIFYLEGITPRAISAYGERKLPNGLVATPNIDSIAHEGARFNNVRCFYPSTWDGWYAVNSGRILRISEMDASRPFGDRYSRYANLYKLLKMVGITRYCHSDTAPYANLFVPSDFHRDIPPAWQPEPSYSSIVGAEEDAKGIWRGDKRAKRMIDFLDDLKPGERFFFCEHMSDTHFPWKRTSLERARELGFPDGLDLYEADDTLPRGGRDDKYSCYLQTVTRMDAQIGLVLDKLKEKNLYDNTIVIVISDHGCQWYEHEHLYYVSHLYDPAIKIPFVMKGPGIPAGFVSDAPIMQIDVLPTLMDLAGVKHANPRPDDPWPCRNLMPLMRGDKSPQYLASLRERDFPLTTHYDLLGVLSNFRYKLIFDRPRGTYQVFDLETDPIEMNNLADRRPDLLEELMERFRTQIQKNRSFLGRIRDDGDPPEE